MKKIVITGGLGYIGTELCKIYSGYSWNDKITVIDNRFISERVNQIRNWNMEFVQGDILDKELIKKYCSDADIVHHLAGITDVPRVKSESNDKHDEKIREVIGTAISFFEKNNSSFQKEWVEFNKLFDKKNLSRKECLMLPFKTLLKALKS